jgi:hypothetical protein
MGKIVSMHPLRAMVKILDEIGAVDGTHYAADTMDPVSVAHSDRAHYCVSAVDINGPTPNDEPQTRAQIREAESVLDLMHQLSFVQGGTFAPRNSDGLFAYTAYDDSAASQRTLTAGEGDGYDVDKVTVLDSGNESIINAARFSTLTNTEGGTIMLNQYAEADQDSLSEFGQLYMNTNESRWLNCIGAIRAGYVSDSVGDTTGQNVLDLNSYSFVLMSHFSPLGWSGMGYCTDNGGVPEIVSGYGLDGSLDKYMYLAAWGLADDGEWYSDPEYIAISDITVAEENPVPPHDTEYNFLDQESWENMPRWIRCDIAGSYNSDGFTNGRGGFGTTQRNWHVGNAAEPPSWIAQRAWFVDVTIPVARIREQLKRYKFGCPRIKISVPLHHYDLEIGDFVALSGDEHFLGFGHDGISSTIIWEIISQEVLILDDNPRIELELARVRDDFVPATITTAYIPTMVPTTPILTPIPLSGNYIIASDAGIVRIDYDGDDAIDYAVFGRGP